LPEEGVRYVDKEIGKESFIVLFAAIALLGFLSLVFTVLSTLQARCCLRPVISALTVNN
jgi:hypothetical protein